MFKNVGHVQNKIRLHVKHLLNVKGTVMQIEKALINDRLRVPKVS